MWATKARLRVRKVMDNSLLIIPRPYLESATKCTEGFALYKISIIYILFYLLCTLLVPFSFYQLVPIVIRIKKFERLVLIRNNNLLASLL